MHRCFLALLALGSSTFALAAEHLALLGSYTDTGSRGIYAVKMDAETGALSTPELMAELPNPEFLALHPNGKFVYAVTQIGVPGGKSAGAVAAFKLDSETGRLTPLNVESTARGSLCHIGIDATGRMLVVASYGAAYVASFPILPDGRVGPLATVIVHEGPLGPNTARQDKPHPHSVTISADNRFAFVADLGLDRIYTYALHPADGTLTAHEPAFAATSPGAGPRHTKFSPDGKSFYALDELDNHVTAFRYDAERGVAEPFQREPTLPADFAGKSTSSEIRVHPNGRFVYSANRGHNSIAVFARDPADGSLSRVEIVPTGGRNPRNFSLTPDGRWLLAAHQVSNNLTVFRVDPDTGRLTDTKQSVPAAKVVCVLFIR